MLSTATIDFTVHNGLGIYRGSAWEVPITVCERDKGVDTPIDLSKMTGKCAIKRNCGDDAPIVTPTVAIGENGLFTLSLTAELTQSIPCRGKCFRDVETLVYDVFFTDENGVTVKALQGIVEVVPSVVDGDD